jgi:hypothetical protein
MKIFNAVLLAGIFAAAAVQADPCADLDIKVLKAVDSSIDDKDYIKFTATVQVPLEISVKELVDTDLTVTLLRSPPDAGTEVASVEFDEDNCKLRSSGKSAICKEDSSRLTISEVSDPS